MDQAPRARAIIDTYELVSVGMVPKIVTEGPISEHAGSAVARVIADATTIVLNEGIDPRVYYRLVTVDGGETDSVPIR